ncbi:sulfite exporter TauE/SafE family protein [Oceanomicrobium pacificus]|uniref:Probable membrane transporter protein n=1 Tax=Oceanomicrobium pacificus TaxID=2692916 RepID=A0A6B0U3C7_9RHOB|nr:sulfite exporter TauE/SafE family protein [Oceanomicrobium pacificus]MXU65461.1 TSUP family transporter [Oceanomicrobium pacificus]
MLDLLPLLALMIVVGGVAGVIAGLLGVGGGIVLVPVFFYTFTALGYTTPYMMQIAIATSLATIVVTSARSVMSHNKKGAVDWLILRGWAPGIAVGAIIGVLVVGRLESRTLMALFGILGLCVSAYMAFGRSEWRLGDVMPTGIRRALTAPVIGLLSVMMGIGGGSFGVPLMTLYGTPIHRAVATAAGFGLIISAPSVIGFLFTGWGTPGRPEYSVGLVNIPVFLVIICMTMLTAPLGVKLAHALNPKPLKRIFAIFIGLVALRMLISAFGA